MRVDVWPVIVRGKARANRARVLWDNGTLYVVHSANRIESLAASEPTLDKRTQVWTAATEDGSVTFTRKGCSGCGFTLNRIPISQIMGES
jgi:hypothetical protein